MLYQHMIQLRDFEMTDAEPLRALFHQSVHQTCHEDYTQAQLDAWAPQAFDSIAWVKRLSEHLTIVATVDDVAVGFSVLEGNAHIDCLFVHSDYQRLGVASTLLNNIEEHAARHNIKDLSADVSITAKPFFIRCGFQVEAENKVNVNGEVLANVRMVKVLGGVVA